MKKFKVYFDQSICSPHEPWVVFLNPILGKYHSPIRGHDDVQIDERTTRGKEIIELTSIQECDFVIFPKFFRMDHFKELKKATQEAKKHKKKVIVFYVSDISDNIKINNIIVFRTSITQYNKENEYCMPPFPGDALEKYGGGKIAFNDPIEDRKPSIGYAGYSNFYNTKTGLLYIVLQLARNIMKIGLIKKVLYAFHKENLYHLRSTIGKGKYIRGKIIRQLQKNAAVQFKFIKRTSGLYLNAKKDIKQEYIDNINNSDFALVMSGNGNYSFRLYEVMSLGKIPIFIDTKCRLPFENEIPYQKLFIWVPFNNGRCIDNYIRKYIETNSKDINTIQKDIRRTYEENMTIYGYFTHMIRSILGLIE